MCSNELWQYVILPSTHFSPYVSSDEDEDGDGITVRNDDELAAMLQYVRTVCLRRVFVTFSTESGSVCRSHRTCTVCSVVAHGCVFTAHWYISEAGKDLLFNI